jgi:thiol-activated cytolysin
MKNIIVSMILAFMLFSCSDTSTGPTKPESDINDLIRNAGIVNTSLTEKDEKRNETTLTNVEENGKKWNIKQSTWSLAKNLDKNIIPFNPNANTLWAGALVQGNEVPNGILNSLGDNISRTPITLTVLSAGNLIGSTTIDNPSNASSSSGLANILKNASGNTASNMIFNQKISYSKEQACLKLGIGAKWLLGSGFEASFSTTNNSLTKEILIFFKQEYYTVSVNEPSKPSDYFGNNVNMNDLTYKVSSSNPLCYVASVSYGRLLMVKMTYNGTETAQKVEASLTGAFSALINGTGSYIKNSIVENSSFSGIILGGSAGGAAKALTGGSIESVLNFINEEANYNSNSPGYPISYTIKNLADNSIVKLGESTEYTVKEYTESSSNYQNFDIELAGFYVFNDCEPYGDGDFYYNLDILDNSNNSLIGGILSIPSNQTVPAGDGAWIYFKGQTKYTFQLPKSQGNYFKIKGKLSEKNSLVADIDLDFDHSFTYPWNPADIDNGAQYNNPGWYCIEMFRDAGCKILLMVKITKK